MPSSRNARARVSRRRADADHRSRGSYRPGLEYLEQRLAPASHDTLATALPLALGGNSLVQAADLSGADQVDLYVVTLNAGDQVASDVRSTGPAFLAANIRVFDASGDQLAFQENSGQSSDTELTFDALAAGQYYFGVASNGNDSYDPHRPLSSGGGSTTGAYSLSLTLSSILVAETAANFTLATAQPIAGTTDGQTIAGVAVIQGTDAIGATAYYQFTARGTGALAASLTPADATAFVPRLALYDANGQLLIQSDGAKDGSAIAQINQHLGNASSPEIYYLGVSAVSTAGGNRNYFLATTFTPSLPVFQPLPVRATPDAVAVGDFNHDGNLDLVSASANPFFVPNNTVKIELGLGDGTFTPAPFALPDPAEGGNYEAGVVPVGDGPAAVAVGDLNGDGNLDIVTANAAYNAATGTDGPGTVSVLLGNGDGTFGPVDTFAAGNGCDAVAVGDFNGDGHLDIVTANAVDNTLSIWLGNGRGGFTLDPFGMPGLPLYGTLPVGADPVAVAVGYFAQDGHLDIATVDQQGNEVSVWLGNGDGSFRAAPDVPVGDSPSSVAVGHFRTNGFADLAVANSASGTVSILLGTGNGGFVPERTPINVDGVTAVTVGDFNNDGNLDLATANPNPNTVSVLLGNGDGTVQPAVDFPVGTNPDAVAVGDFNHDGNLDLVDTNSSDFTVSVLLGRGDGTLRSTAAATAVGAEPLSVAVADLNHDGNPDLVTADAGSNSVSVALGRGDGTFLPAVSYPVGAFPASVAVADLNGDGNLDLVVANKVDNTVSVLLGRGDGTFLPAPFTDEINGVKTDGTFPVGLGPFSVAVGDFNGDGIPDIVTANSGDSTVSVFLGNGDGSFMLDPFASPGLPAYGTARVGNDPVAVVVGDFTGDGNLDIVTANYADNTISVLLGNGHGAFTADPNSSLGLPAGTFAVDDAPFALAAGRFRNNGGLDIAVACVGPNNGDTPGTVVVVQNNGLGDFVSGPSLPVGNFPASVAVGDVDGDGNLDLIAANTFGNSVSIYRGNGDGTFRQPAVTFNQSGFPYAVAAADLNHDGQPDLVVTESGINAVTVFLNHAGGGLQPITSADGIASRDVPYLQDLNGDGIPDEIILDDSGQILFRPGLGSDSFAPPIANGINPVSAPRDDAVFRTSDGLAVAAIDDVGNTVSVYAWDPKLRTFRRRIAFTTGNLPVRIAAADLTGNGLDDLVVSNDFDDSVTIALQNPDGSFTTITRPVGAAPSDIAFVHEAGKTDPDIAIGDQASGDVTILLNDATASSPPTFAQEYRFRAGTGLDDLDPGTGTVASALQTVALAAGDFTVAGRDDLVALNRGAESFTLLPNQGQASFADPQPANIYFPTAAQPSQALPITFPGDPRPSIAMLMEDRAEIWIYRNNGDGGFLPPLAIPAGNQPTGFSITTIDETLAILVGNAFGDILALLYDGKGGFAPDRTHLQGAPLAVGEIAGTGEQFAVVADQQLNQAALYYRIPGTDNLGTPIAVDGTHQLPLLAPGAVQLFTVPGDSNPYLVVANSLSNDVLVYHFDPLSGNFDLAGMPLLTGDDPVSITQTDINGDGIPDLLAADAGSNDVSVFLGNQTTPWSATPYERLDSLGRGPIAAAAVDSGNANGPSIAVANSDGTAFVLPGIGSSGNGTGFFKDVPTQSANLGTPIVGALASQGGQVFVVGADGSVSLLDGNEFTTVVNRGVAALTTTQTTFGTFLVAGLDDGTVDLLSGSGAVLASAPTGFADEPSALQALQNGNALDVYVTQIGSDVPVIVTLPFISTAPIAQAAAVNSANSISVPSADLVLVATLLSGELSESTPGNPAGAAPSEAVFAVFLPAGQIPFAASDELPDDPGLLPVGLVETARPPAAPGWESFPLGVPEALRQRFEPQPNNDRLQEMLDLWQDVLRRLRGIFNTPFVLPAETDPVTPNAAPLLFDMPDQRGDAPAADAVLEPWAPAASPEAHDLAIADMDADYPVTPDAPPGSAFEQPTLEALGTAACCLASLGIEATMRGGQLPRVATRGERRKRAPT